MGPADREKRGRGGLALSSADFKLYSRTVHVISKLKLTRRRIQCFFRSNMLSVHCILPMSAYIVVIQFGRKF